jgi:hypothetical protein
MAHWAIGQLAHLPKEVTMFNLTLCVAIYLGVDLFLLCLGLVQMLRHESRTPEVVAITLLWPWVVFRASLSIGLKIVRELGMIAGETLNEMRMILGV